MKNKRKEFAKNKNFIHSLIKISASFFYGRVSCAGINKIVEWTKTRKKFPKTLRKSKQHLKAHHLFTSGCPNTHIQRGKHINETMYFHPKSFTVPDQVVHCLILTCTHTHQIFNNLKSTKMRSNRAMSRQNP
jgi:hypothetical protein